MAATLVLPRWPLPCLLFAQRLLLARVGNEPLTLCFLTRELARAPDRLGLFPVFALRRFFIRAPLLHFTKYAFALHFLLQDTEGLINVVIADKNLQWESSFLKSERSLPERESVWAPIQLRRFAGGDATCSRRSGPHARRLPHGSRAKSLIVTGRSGHARADAI